MRGAFTTSILEALGQVRLDQITYYDLFNQLPRSGSHRPHCGGFNKHRLVFSTTLGTDRKTFRLTEHQKGTLEAEPTGTHHEIVDQGGNAKVFSFEDPRMLILDVADADSLILSRMDRGDEFVTHQRERVPVSDSENPESILTVFIKQDFEKRLASILSQPNRGMQNYRPQWVQVDDPSDANVKLSSDSSCSFKIETSFDIIPGSSNIIPQFEREHELNDLLNVLHAVAHFNYHLLHNNGHEIEQKFHIELYLLTDVEGDHVPNLEVGNLLKDNESRIVFDKHANYGFTIVNDTEHSLFLYLFYFDPSDYSIGVSSLFQMKQSFRSSLADDIGTR
jgi:hypothetical protein